MNKSPSSCSSALNRELLDDWMAPPSSAMLDASKNKTIKPEATSPVIRTKLQIVGIVQGVGFRPFVYRLARKYCLTGYVLNNSQGVTLEVQGDVANVNHFIEQFDMPPPLARIDSIAHSELSVNNACAEFVIVESHNQLDAVVAVSPDKSTCQDCLDEMQDPANRHFGYPFINCTHCGPRYTLVNALPYDRKHTSMASFSMCPECEASYIDPMDRRYHAQPISCPQCGPQLRFLSSCGESLFVKEQALTHAVERLQAGDILAVKGLGGFHLVVDATNDRAVRKLRDRKNRPHKPLAVMMPSLDVAKKWASGSLFEWQQLAKIERPIVLMRKAMITTNNPILDGTNEINDSIDGIDDIDRNSLTLSPAIAPKIDKIGIFLPYTPLHHQLMAKLNRPLVATSANRSGEPIICSAEQIHRQLAGIFDGVLDHDRPILNACDDSIIQCINHEVQILRLARGYAPFSLPLAKPAASHILAVGAQQKNAIALAFADQVILSPHIGDLFSIEAEQYFSQTLATFERLYHFQPHTLCRDIHPNYAPSKWSQERCEQDQNLTQLSIQHHYAHILSVMAANQFTAKVLGFSFDGTGLGTDGTLWGGEAMIADIHGFTRICHLKPFRLIGGERAITDPKRILIALLFQQYSLEAVLALPLSIIKQCDPAFICNLHKIWSSAHCTQCSSIGRLFDAVAILLGLMEHNQYEGQSGMLLEAAANQVTMPKNDIAFCLPIVGECWDVDQLMSQLIEAVTVTELTEQRVSLIARGFIHAISDAVTQLSIQYSSLPVVLSGGVFQNRFLTEHCHKQLERQGNLTMDSQKVPINDGGIALGQLWFGIHKAH